MDKVILNNPKSLSTLQNPTKGNLISLIQEKM